MHIDPYTQGARDCRAGRPDASPRMDRYQRAAYRQGYRHAFRLACHRLDIADTMPGHFGSTHHGL